MKNKLTLAVVLLGYLALPMSMSGTTVALPQIGAALGASGGALQWVVTGYFLTASSFMLVAGSTGDLFGRRRIYRLGAATYALGSLVAALTPHVLLLDVARTVTGVGAAGVMAGGGAILASTFTGGERTKAFAAMGTTAGVGMAIGPTLAGWLVGALGWRATFGAFAVTGLLLLAGTVAMAESRAQRRARVDWLGAVSFIAGLASIMFAITQSSRAGWTSPLVLGLLAAGAGFLGVFAAAERRSANPVLDLTLLGNRRFVGWLLAGVVMVLGFGGMMSFLPTYLQGASAMSARDSGLVMLFSTAPTLALPILTSRLVNRGVSPRMLITGGLLLIAIGNAWLTRLHPGIGGAELLGPLLTVGIGIGLATGLIDAQAMNQVDRSRTGMAAGLLNTVRGGTQTLVMALFGSVLITVLTSRLGGEQADRVATGELAGAHQAAQLTDAWQLVLWGIAGLTALGALAVATLLAPPREVVQPAEPVAAPA
ncbi:MFS transporter [Saccharopolyspora mangrovi]|uniref:MFS transporter n=1 Tax=Saccharopolyspora mangrovi TaxID=3082379 RepID=A0ABU6AC53_9PSEU|nr:MFS transporter [Saccharopolyspora sp. S2-29]MEB3369058.1 MFS transporter [Saccharopolyspora sp. S2-29]